MWAFGVTLWELFTYGFQPWAGLTGQQVCWINLCSVLKTLKDFIDSVLLILFNQLFAFDFDYSYVKIKQYN